MKLNACLNKRMCMFGLSVLIMSLIIAVILGLLAGPDSPLTWILIAALLIIPYVHRRLTARHFVEWKDEYSVGIESIDLQHKKLLHLINQLQTAVDYSTGDEFERDALNELVDYTNTHFTYEEGLLEQNNYPGFESHKEQHKQMVKHVQEVLSEYEKDHDTAMNNAANYLKDWLIDHINGTDKQYSSFLIEKGVK